MTLHIFSPYLKKYDRQPCGYVHIHVEGFQGIVCDWAASAVAEALNTGTLHEWAALQPLKNEMQGRGVIYAVDLPTTPATPVVIRRNRHGGLLHALTGECFLFPTKAPLELATSLRLSAAGIPTPEVIAYVIYPIAGIFVRSDVMTRRLPTGDDVPAAWKKASKTERYWLLAAMARLLNSLSDIRAWHPDLNLKNIYIAGSGSDLTAYVLDVDRVTFTGRVDVAERNFNRVVRSARKWRELWGLDFDEDSLAQLAGLTQGKK